MTDKKENPDWVKGVFTDGQYKQVENRELFSVLAGFMGSGMGGGFTMEEAERAGMFTRDLFSDRQIDRSKRKSNDEES